MLIKLDGIICIGCVIQGETKHFDYVCQGATNGIMNIGLRYNKPCKILIQSKHKLTLLLFKKILLKKILKNEDFRIYFY